MQLAGMSEAMVRKGETAPIFAHCAFGQSVYFQPRTGAPAAVRRDAGVHMDDELATLPARAKERLVAHDIFYFA